MTRSSAVAIENSFVKGLLTEATGLNFPENACTETYDCVFEHTGEVRRRLGIQLEDDFVLDDAHLTGNVIREFLWKSVAQNGEYTFLILQIGHKLNFFLVSSGSVSPGKKDFQIDLNDFRPSVSTPAVEGVTASFASGNGYLFVTHPYCNPFYVSYDSTLDTVTATAITVEIRDFEGLEDNLDVDYRPRDSDGLSTEHHYNLLNQGWGLVTPETADNTTYLTLPLLFAWRYPFPYGIIPPAAPDGGFPSNSDVWWTFKTVLRPTLDDDGNPVFPAPLEAFSLVEVNKATRGNTPAPKGHFVLTAWNQDRASVPFFPPNPLWPYPDDFLGSLSSLPTVSSGYLRPTQVAFFASRVWYAGIDAEKFNTKIYFSKIIEKNSDFGKCYQFNDPTSEQAQDLLASDGGVIVIPEIAKVIKMQQVGNDLYIFATNGVWRISGSVGVGFTATDHSIVKVSSTPALSALSFADVEGTPMWWNHDGIWTIQPDQSGTSSVTSLTHTTIASFYDDIPSDSKRYAKAAYNPLERVVQWVFRSTAADSVEESYQYDRILNLNLLTQAYYPWTISADCHKVVGVFVLQGISNSSETEVVVDNNSNNVTTGAGNVTVNVVTHTDISSRFKYITVDSCSDIETVPTKSFTHQENQTSVGPSYTFTSVPLSTASADRVIVVFAAGTTNNRTLSSITIDGTPLTLHQNITGHGLTGSFLDLAAAVGSIPWPTGTTADIGVNFSGFLDACNITVSAITGLLNTDPFDSGTNSTTAGNPSVTVEVPSAGIVLAGLISGPTSGYPGSTSELSNVEWGNLGDEDFDSNLTTSGGAWKASFASEDNLDANTAMVINPTGGSLGRELLLVTSWGGTALGGTGSTTQSFAEFTNDGYLDWPEDEDNLGTDYSSYFTTGYKVHGDAIKKFQSNYVQLYTRNDVFSNFDFQSRWDYSISGDTGRWSNIQRITMDDANYKFRTRRLKTRGHGKALQYRVNSVTGEPFNIIGWSTFESSNQLP